MQRIEIYAVLIVLCIALYSSEYYSFSIICLLLLYLAKAKFDEKEKSDVNKQLVVQPEDITNLETHTENMDFNDKSVRVENERYVLLNEQNLYRSANGIDMKMARSLFEAGSVPLGWWQDE